jgi:hypothetical protein
MPWFPECRPTNAARAGLFQRAAASFPRIGTPASPIFQGLEKTSGQQPEASRQFSKAWKNAAEIFQALENNPAAFRVAA